MNDRLLAHHALAFHIMSCAATVRDGPAAGQKLHRLIALIFDADMIGPEPPPAIGLRLFGKKTNRNANDYVVRNREKGEQGLHARQICLKPDCRQCLIQIGNQVFGIFEADVHPQHALHNPHILAHFGSYTMVGR